MSLSRADLILKQHSQMLTDRSTVDATNRELAQFILPRKNIHSLVASSVNRIIGPGTTQEGGKRTTSLFDSTAINANELLAASMHGAMISPQLKWFSLRMRDEKMNEIDAVTEWLESCRDRMLAAFRQSNLNQEIHELFLDLGAFGTGAMLLEERPPVPGRFTGLRFQAVPVGDYCIAEDEEGRVNTLYRTFRVSVMSAVRLFGAGNLSDRTQELIEKHPYQKVEFIHAIYPRENVVRKTGAKSYPFASCYVERVARKLVGEGGYREFPGLVPRWTKISGETWGRGPGHTALPDVKSLNKAKELALKAWAKQLDPPSVELDDGIIGTVRLTPGGRTVARQLDAIKFMEFKSNLQFDQIKVEDLKNSIRFIFFWDQLQPLGAARSAGNPATATEVLKRIELVHQVLGPTMGRQESELLAPMVERAFALMLRARALDPPPPIIQQLVAQGGEIDIVYEGPLARSQRASDITAIEGMLTDLLPLEQLAPGIVTDNYDLDALSRYVGAARGVPATLILSPEQVKVKKDARAQAQAAAQQQAQMAAIADAAGKTAPLAKIAATNPSVLTGPLPGQPLREVQKGQPIQNP